MEQVDGRVASLLTRADGATSLPRLGGMARPDGVVIVSERFWAFAGRDGSLREGRMPALPQWVHYVPLARGLARLGMSLAPLFAPFLLFLLPGAARTPVGIGATLALAAWMLRGRTLRLHGAEHRAIA